MLLYRSSATMSTTSTPLQEKRTTSGTSDTDPYFTLKKASFRCRASKEHIEFRELYSCQGRDYTNLKRLNKFRVATMFLTSGLAGINGTEVASIYTARLTTF